MGSHHRLLTYLRKKLWLKIHCEFILFSSLPLRLGKGGTASRHFVIIYIFLLFVYLLFIFCFYFFLIHSQTLSMFFFFCVINKSFSIESPAPAHLDNHQ